MIGGPPRAPLFPYPPLSRSGVGEPRGGLHALAEPQLRELFGLRQSMERSEEHTSELQSPYVISYAVFFLNDRGTAESSPLPLPAALPIWCRRASRRPPCSGRAAAARALRPPPEHG